MEHWRLANVYVIPRLERLTLAMREMMETVKKYDGKIPHSEIGQVAWVGIEKTAL